MIAPASVPLSVLASARPPFLLLTPACLFLGIALALTDGAALDLTLLAAVVISALAAHVSVNALNEYADFVSGLDLRTHRTPFSGGSGFLPANPTRAMAVRLLGWIAMTVSIVTGAWLLWQSGWQLLPLGLLGVALVTGYSGPISRLPWVCLLAPGLAFGPVMVMGSYFVMLHAYRPAALVGAALMLCLASNLLLLNQFPDQEADRSVGRRNLVTEFGIRFAARTFISLLIVAFAVMAIAIWAGVLTHAALWGFATLPLAFWLGFRVHRLSIDGSGLLPAMALNVLVCLSTPVALATGLLLGLL